MKDGCQGTGTLQFQGSHKLAPQSLGPKWHKAVHASGTSSVNLHSFQPYEEEPQRSIPFIKHGEIEKGALCGLRAHQEILSGFWRVLQ